MKTIDTRDIEKTESGLLPVVECADGFTMSVQGSSYNYCTPRDNSGVYEAMEVGFPSAEESLLMEYAEDRDAPTDTVYGWVPVEVILAVIEKHGGCAKNCLPSGS